MVDFAQVRRAKSAHGEIYELKGEGVIWQRPPPSLSDLYGIGPGQIPIHHTPSDPTNITVDGSGLVQHSLNLGGAGSYFDLAPMTGRAPIYSGAGFLFNNLIDKCLVFSNAPDLVGVHLVIALKTGAATNQYLSIANNGGLWQRVYIDASKSQKTFRVMTGGKVTAVAGNISLGTDEWAVAELRMDASGVHALLNGVIVGQKATPLPDYLVQSIGYNGTQNQVTIGTIGDFCSVIIDSNYDATTPEPAVLLARQTLAAQYGVVL